MGNFINKFDLSDWNYDDKTFNKNISYIFIQIYSNPKLFQHDEREDLINISC